VTTFSGIVGHRSVVDLLESELHSPAHAYLFVGPSSVGKATVARRFASALACGDDQNCLRRALEGKHPDVALIEPDGRTAITVDQARRVVAAASRSPLEADRRVFLFEEGGMLNDEAANALLKTLEEPSPNSSFIIVAESTDDLPDTVASRCRTVVFGRVDEATLAADLVAITGMDPEQAERVAGISGGRPGLAITLASRPEAAAFRAFWLSIPLRLPQHPGLSFHLADEAIGAIDPLLTALKQRQDEQRGGADDRELSALRERQTRELKRQTDALHVAGLEILAGFYRDAAAVQFGAPPRNSDIPVVSLMHVAPQRAVASAERVLRTVESLRANQRPQLALASLFADLAADE
jgi:DNA polymerase-3 subunit delta'